MNVELFLYLKKNLLGMFKVSHLVEKATGRHEQWTHLSGFFFNICGQHCSYSLNYSLARPGAGEANWLSYIILDFVLGFSGLC